MKAQRAREEQKHQGKAKEKETNREQEDGNPQTKGSDLSAKQRKLKEQELAAAASAAVLAGRNLKDAKAKLKNAQKVLSKAAPGRDKDQATAAVASRSSALKAAKKRAAAAKLEVSRIAKGLVRLEMNSK